MIEVRRNRYMFKFDSQAQYTMPAHFGLGTSKTPSWWYHHVTNLIVPYRTDRDQLAAE